MNNTNLLPMPLHVTLHNLRIAIMSSTDQPALPPANRNPLDSHEMLSALFSSQFPIFSQPASTIIDFHRAVLPHLLNDQEVVMIMVGQNGTTFVAEPMLAIKK